MNKITYNMIGWGAGLAIGVGVAIGAGLATTQMKKEDSSSEEE
jgi:hypothetical protein